MSEEKSEQSELFPLELPANQQCQSEEATKSNRIIVVDVSSAGTVIGKKVFL